MRSPVALRIVLSLAVLALGLSGTQAQSLRGGGPNVSVGPRMPNITAIGPRGPRFDNPPKFDGKPNGGGTVVIGTPGGNFDGPPPQRRLSKNSPPRRASGVPPAGETHFVRDEVIAQFNGVASAATIDNLARRHRLARLDSQVLQLANITIARLRILGGRSVVAVIRALESEGAVAWPNYVFGLSQSEAGAEPGPASLSPPAQEGDPGQYTLSKLHLPQAHGLARGDRVLVAVIDSAIDTSHPELAGMIADSFDTLKPGEPHSHGTAIAGAIVAHARLMGVAPHAHLLAIRAFDPQGGGAEGTTFNILKGLDWAVAKGARIVNMSFAGPADALLSRSLAAAKQKGVVLIAASGNAGPKSPPLYPAADPNVIAVTATDADDRLFAQANRGNHIAIAAPGVDILLPAPGASYQLASGTSFAAAHVSGIAALMLERQPALKPDAVRAILMASAHDLGAKGRDPEFGAGLADAYRAVAAAGGSPADAMSAASAASR